MLLGWAADAVLVIHLTFIAFVLLGGLLVWRWTCLAWVHLPAAAWGATVELLHLQCPLTPLEIRLREAAGQAGFEGGFIAHYLIPVIYPTGLTPRIQLGLGVLVVLLNGLIYARLLLRIRR
jgi:hypothetical protein